LRFDRGLSIDQLATIKPNEQIVDDYAAIAAELRLEA
jgi:hypothetical protein